MTQQSEDDWRKQAKNGLSVRNVQPAIKTFRGDSKLAAGYLPLAQVLLGDLENRLTLGGIGYGARTVKLADGTLIKVSFNSGIRSVLIDASRSIYIADNRYRSFIFIPKDGSSYVHAKSLQLPYDVNATVGEDELYYYRYTYAGITSQPIAGRCIAEVVAHNAIEGYGNQNFTVADTIYSWWHSSTGDLPIIHIVPTDYKFLAGNDEFLVYTFSRRTFAVDPGEKLPCYTHAMVSVKYINDETGIIDNVPVFEFGYFVESDGYYYFYTQPPVYYKNNKLQPRSMPENTQLILGLHITKERQTIVTLQNPLKMLGTVFCTVETSFSGGYATHDLASLLDVGSIRNELCYPVRFSPNGDKFSGMFYTFVDENAGFALMLCEFIIRDSAVLLAFKEIQTYQYTISSTVVRTAGDPEILDSYQYVDDTYNNQVAHPPDNCHGGGYTDGELLQRTTLTGEVGTRDTAVATEETLSTTIGEPTIAVNYSTAGTLVRCTIDMHFTTAITNNAEEKSGSVTDYSFSTRYAQTVPPPSIPNPPTTSPPVYEDRWDYVTGWPNCSGAFGFLIKSDLNNYRVISADSNYIAYNYTSTSTIEKFNLKTSDSAINFPLGTGETTIIASGTSNISTGTKRIYIQNGLLDGGVYSREDKTLGPFSSSTKLHYEQIALDNNYGTWGTESTSYSKDFEQQSIELTHLNLQAKVYAYNKSEDSFLINVSSTRNVDETSGYGTRTEQHLESDNVNGTTINDYTSATGDYTINTTTQSTTGFLAGESQKQFGIVEYSAIANTKNLGTSDVANVNRSLTSSTEAYTLLPYTIGPATAYTISNTINVPYGIVRGILNNSSAASLCSDMRNARPLYLYSTYRKNVFTTYGNDYYLNLFDDPIAEETALLKAIDTNLPIRYGVEQPPVNQPESGIGDQICPIGLLRPLRVPRPKSFG